MKERPACLFKWVKYSKLVICPVYHKFVRAVMLPYSRRLGRLFASILWYTSSRTYRKKKNPDNTFKLIAIFFSKICTIKNWHYKWLGGNIRMFMAPNIVMRQKGTEYLRSHILVKEMTESSGSIPGIICSLSITESNLWALAQEQFSKIQRSILAVVGDHIGCWGWNLGWLHEKSVPYLLYFSLWPL